MQNENTKDFLNWVYKRGYDAGLLSQKIFQILEYVEDFHPISESCENFKDNLKLDLEYLSEIIDEDKI